MTTYYAIQRQSDGRYHAPTSNTYWRWHKDERQAYPLKYDAAQRSLAEIRTAHAQNYDRKDWLADETFNVVKLD